MGKRSVKKRKKRSTFKRQFNTSKILKNNLIPFAPKPKLPDYSNAWLTRILEKYRI